MRPTSTTRCSQVSTANGCFRLRLPPTHRDPDPPRLAPRPQLLSVGGRGGGRILTRLGAEVRFFHPSGLPLVDDGVDASHPKVRELRDLTAWCEGLVWCLPERHGAMTGVMKTQTDWIPLSEGAVRPTQGKTLAVMQASGGSQSFNAVNQMRVLGRWMRMLTIPNQSSIPKGFQEFDESGRMRLSLLCDRIVDVMEELMKFTLLTRDRAEYLVDRYSERKENAEALMKRVNLSAAT